MAEKDFLAYNLTNTKIEDENQSLRNQFKTKFASWLESKLINKG
jgi:hypothetical protein